MNEESNKGKRLINTDQFGQLEVDSQYVFEFPEGIFGFENLREFVLIHQVETAPFRWLISLEEPSIGFPLLSPWHIDLSYKPSSDIDLDREVIMVIITLEDEQGKMTANMKAPIVFDVPDRKAKQVILPSDKYLTNYVIPLHEANTK